MALLQVPGDSQLGVIKKGLDFCLIEFNRSRGYLKRLGKAGN